MGILDRLLSALGLRSEGSSPDRGETTGTAGRVERERSSEAESTPHSPATEAENEPAASGTEAAGSTGSMVDVEEGVEPAEAAGPAAENAPGADVVSPEHVDDDPDTIEGIGPAYAERLAGAGISTVGELAVADAEGVAEATGISEKRVSRWIERARAR
jgi:predicted flap endonuclease-1-like 5' DNA nuclease